MSRSFDIYAAERRAGHVLFIAGLWVVRAYILTKYRAGDARRHIRGAR
jgi:hypothetical protein